MPPSQAQTSLRNVKMTPQDFAGIANGLAKAGVSQDEITKLGQQVQSSQGLTWGQMMQSLQQSTVQQYLPTTNLSDSDKSNISSLLSSLGFNPQQTADLTSSLANGKPSRVFDLISAKLKGLDSSQTTTVTQDQVASLAKALNLPASATQNLLSQFGGQDSMELSPSGLSQMFSVAKVDLSQVLSQVSAAMKNIKGVVAPAMDGARQRLDIAQGTDSQAQAAQTKPSSLMPDPMGSQASGSNTGSGNQTGAGRENRSTDDDPPGFQGGGRQPGAQAQAKDWAQKAMSEAQDEKNAVDEAWAQLSDKLDAQGDPLLSSGGSTASGQAATSAALGQTAAQPLGQAQTNPVVQAARSQAVPFLEQVQSGILKNMGQGVSQLTLELTPESLGKLNVMLTVKGKDVQAVIKADSPEAEKALTDNLHQIKQSLENEGLTVSKLEVRTSLQQDPSMGQQQWAGAEKHNLSQERREALGRMRTSSLLAGVDASGLAQQMQSEGVEANNSQGGLDIMA
jgi:flagellar hook-length control protein FliK